MRLLKLTAFSLLFVTSQTVSSQDFISNLDVNLPMKTSNNAVAGARVNGIPYVYTFGGIDSTKLYTGIHLKSFRFNTQSSFWDTLPDLPDTRGKIAAAASAIDSIIYIIGGYYVFRGGSETSSDKVHRFNINTNSYLSDGLPVPIATDDHVQAVWQDSLIFIITGWSNSGNIPNVQIYNPALDSWSIGNPVPNNNRYKSFGASGTIIGNIIYYFGGASSGSGFPIQNTLRVGNINPLNPTQITWHDSVLNPAISNYRAACIGNSNGINWMGGSETTYNYNGVAYNGTGGVSATGKNIYYNPIDSTMSYRLIAGEPLPMDLRGIADFGSTFYMVGGMINNQEVTDKVWRLNYIVSDINKEKLPQITIHPNPTSDFIIIKGLTIKNSTYNVFNVNGELMLSGSLKTPETSINLQNLSSGCYYIKLTGTKLNLSKKIIIK